MNQINVHTMCAYYSKGKKHNQEAWDSTNFCLAVKSKTVSREFTLPRSYGGHTITQTNVHITRILFGGFVKRAISIKEVDDCIFVPVPSKDSFSLENFRTHQLLKEALINCNKQIIPALRFKEKLEQASRGGSRGYQFIYKNLETTTSVAGRKIILVDDIVTSGGTMLAAKSHLEESGATVILAFACGRTDETEQQPFSEKTVPFSTPPTPLFDLIP